jgi:uncharacterized repeat protein (TIGR03803 family)
MTKSPQNRDSVLGMCLRTATVAAVLAIIPVASTQASAPTQEPTFTVLHAFTGGAGEGANPYAGLIHDEAGNLYGTTLNGGLWQHGTVFKLDPAGVVTTLYSFERRGDGNKPYGGLVRDSAGDLFGMTPTGIGDKVSDGIIYRISASGKEAKPHVFTGPPSDGLRPYGGLIRDQGTFYGTTSVGGSVDQGTVFSLSNGREIVLYSFNTHSGDGDGANPEGTLVRDEAGNLYGTTLQGGNDSFGTVFRLDSTGNETILHAFSIADGSPGPGLMLDQLGNLYGTTNGGSSGDGTLFEMDTGGNNYTILYTFPGGANGVQALGALVADKAGNLYGTTRYGGDLSCGAPYGCGVVFKLSPAGNETILHTFSGKDGMVPSSGLVRDAAGNLYGTAPRGGSTETCDSGCGVVFKITP